MKPNVNDDYNMGLSYVLARDQQGAFHYHVHVPVHAINRRLFSGWSCHEIGDSHCGSSVPMSGCLGGEGYSRVLLSETVAASGPKASTHDDDHGTVLGATVA